MPIRSISLQSFGDDTQQGALLVKSDQRSKQIEFDLSDGDAVSEHIPGRTNENSSRKKKSSLSRWKNAGKWLKAAASPHDARKFLKAVKSKTLEGPVRLKVLEFRHQCCHGVTINGEYVSEPCPARYEAESGGVFCNSCGCAEWKFADISVDPARPTRSKLAYPDLECPRNRFSPVRGERVTNDIEVHDVR